MRYNNKYLVAFLFAVLSFGFSSCDTENEGTLYTPSTGEVSFLWNKYTALVGGQENSFKVQLVRGGNIANPATVNVSIVDKYEAFSVPSTITIPAGENSIWLEVEADIIADKEYSIEIQLSGTDATLVGNAKVDLLVSKEYNWVSLGTGLFNDYFMFDNTYEVEILQAEGFPRYRVMDPYSEGLKTEDRWVNGSLAGESCEYIEVYFADNIAYYNDFKVGYNYQGDTGQPVYACHPTSTTLSSQYSPAYNKWVNDKTFQLAPYYFIIGVGGWNNTQYDEVIVVQLP